MNSNTEINDDNSIAVIGIGCRFPGANSAEEFWNNLINEVVSIKTLSDDELRDRGVSEANINHPNYVKTSSYPDGADTFDAAFFGISPGEAETMDPQHRLLLECAHAALEDAGINAKNYKGQVGVYGGVGVALYIVQNLKFLLDNPFDLKDGKLSHNMQIGIGNDKCYASSRISHKLDLKGPSINVDGACATSLMAIHLACKSLLDYECDTALAGGAKVDVPFGIGYLFEEGGMTSPEGVVRSFDADAKGAVFGSGCGMVALKRLTDALDEGDEIYAIIKGSATNNDGSDKIGFTAPSYKGQRNVIAEALAFAEVSAESISYVEAHGTGTPLGDPIEVMALTEAYRATTDKKAYCALGSVKPNVGHMEAAAGVAGLIKAALALKHKIIPASLNYSRPNPEIDFKNSPFFVNSRQRKWISDGAPRRAGVSSFGVGGSNVHVVMEEFTRPHEVRPSRNEKLIVLSAKTASALEQATNNLADHFERHPEIDFADAAFTLQVGREAFNHRRILCCKNREEAITRLRSLSPLQVSTGIATSKPAMLGFMFPGQGSQHIDMALALFESEPVFKETLTQCALLLEPHLNLDLLEVLYPSEARRAENNAKLGQTWLTQPALFSIEYALAKLWKSWGVIPDMMIGHSIGEYVAACLADVFSLEDALKLVSARGRLMQSLPSGDMLSVPLSAAELQPLLPDNCDLAGVNAPKISVVSGPADAVAKLEELLASKDILARKIDTSHAFHSAMMEPILEDFSILVAAIQLKAPTMRFISNVTGTWIEDSQATDPNYWVKHLRGTVRFSEGIATLLREKNTFLLEVGPGQVLSGLARQNEQANGERIVSSLNHPKDKASAQQTVTTALGRLWIGNVKFDWEAFHVNETRRRVGLPTYPFERERYWIEPPSYGMDLKPELLGGRQPIENWFYTPAWHRNPMLPKSSIAANSERQWLIFNDELGLGEALKKQILERGEKVVSVGAGKVFSVVSDHEFIININDAADYSKLLDALQREDKSPDHVVHMWSVTQSQSTLDMGELTLKENKGFYSLLYLAQALGSSMSDKSIRLNVVSNGLADVTGVESLDPLKALVLGPAKVIPQEYPNILCRHIDIETVQVSRVVNQLFAELQSEENISVAHRGNNRWIGSYSPLCLQENVRDSLPFKKNGVYLITGGMSGIGMVVAEKLAMQYQARLVLTGRSSIPPRDRWDSWLESHYDEDATSQKIIQIRKLESFGAKVLPLSADVTDFGQMQQAVEQSRKVFGEINGVMQSTGIAGGGIIQLKTREMADKVLSPKVKGALILQALLKEESLDFIILNSSLYSVVAEAGQVDYCAANNFLDMLAKYSERGSGKIISINWDSWSEVGIAHRLSNKNSSSALEVKKTSHPILERCAQSDGETIFVSDINVSKHWIVDEHRLDGTPVIPGAAIIEMAVAAFREKEEIANAAVELQDVMFLAPLEVPDDSERRVRLTLTEVSGGYRFSVQSDTDDGGRREYAIGQMNLAYDEPDKQDLESLRLSNQVRTMMYEGDETRAFKGTEGILSFGPRWHNLKQIYVGEGQALSKVELADEYIADLADYHLHPALLDMATGLSNGLWLEDDDKSENGAEIYLPFSYDRMTVWGTLPKVIYSFSRLNVSKESQSDSLSFDIWIMDENGEELVAIEGFNVKRFEMQQKSLPAIQERPVSNKPIVSTLLDNAISSAEGYDALERILGYNQQTQVIVSTEPLDYVLAISNRVKDKSAAELISKIDTQEIRHERPDLDTPFVAPSNETEEKVSLIWQELLGLKQIGINDSFFELGGDSLLATQIVTQVQKVFDLRLELKVVFEATTPGLLAEHIIATQLVSAERIDVNEKTHEVGTI